MKRPLINLVQLAANSLKTAIDSPAYAEACRRKVAAILCDPMAAAYFATAPGLPGCLTALAKEIVEHPAGAPVTRRFVNELIQSRDLALELVNYHCSGENAVPGFIIHIARLVHELGGGDEGGNRDAYIN